MTKKLKRIDRALQLSILAETDNIEEKKYKLIYFSKNNILNQIELRG